VAFFALFEELLSWLIRTQDNNNLFKNRESK
jgi:hypothetical protein